MTPFADDTRAQGTMVDSVPSPLGGSVGFSTSAQLLTVPSGWNNWSHGYTGDVYWVNDTEVTMTLPAGTVAFYFYVEGNIFSTWTFEAVLQDGTTTSGETPVTTPNGAKYMGFYTTNPDNPIVSCTVTVGEGGSLGFAVGEFGISTGDPLAPPPEAGTVTTGDAAEVTTQVEGTEPQPTDVTPDETTTPAPTEITDTTDTTAPAGDPPPAGDTPADTAPVQPAA
jgi:hypothetical protein